MACVENRSGGWFRRLTVVALGAALLPGLYGVVGGAPTGGGLLECADRTTQRAVVVDGP